MSSADRPQLHSADLPELIASGGARTVLNAAKHDTHLARVLTYIEDELSERLCTDMQDAPAVSLDERVERRYRLMARMAGRYRSAGIQGRSNACLMLAAMHRLAGSDRLRQV